MTKRQREMLECAAEQPSGAVILPGRSDRRIANGLAALGVGYVDDSGRYVYGAHFVINEAGHAAVAAIKGSN